jgi:Flp pilus assembly protein TadD
VTAVATDRGPCYQWIALSASLRDRHVFRAAPLALAALALAGCPEPRNAGPEGTWIGTALSARPPDPPPLDELPAPAPRVPEARAAAPAEDAGAAPAPTPRGEPPALGEATTLGEATALGATGGDGASTVDQLIAEARRLLDEGKHDAALLAARRAAIRDVESFDAHLLVGRASAATGSFGASLQAYRNAVNLRGDDVEALYGLALAQVNLGRGRDAQTTLAKLQKVRPDEPRLTALLAKARALVGDAEGAAALEVKAGGEGADLRAASLLAGAGKYDEAAAAYARAAKEKPDDPMLQLQLGSAYAFAGKLDQAAGALTRATSLAPKDARTWKQLAAVRERQGDAAGALAAYEGLMKHVPNADPTGRLKAKMATLRERGEAAPE